MNFKKFYLTAEGWANRKRFWLLIECILAGTPGPNRFGPAGNLLLAEGVNILTISRRVGHAKTSLTLDTTPT
jgi:uncharacterized membrane protein YhaH (DUF805 family)